jgi:hypothetical protein
MGRLCQSSLPVFFYRPTCPCHRQLTSANSLITAQLRDIKKRFCSSKAEDHHARAISGRKVYTRQEIPSQPTLRRAQSRQHQHRRIKHSSAAYRFIVNGTIRNPPACEYSRASERGSYKALPQLVSNNNKNKKPQGSRGKAQNLIQYIKEA